VCKKPLRSIFALLRISSDGTADFIKSMANQYEVYKKKTGFFGKIRFLQSTDSRLTEYCREKKVSLPEICDLMDLNTCKRI